MAQPGSQNPMYMSVPDKIELSSAAVPPFSGRDPVGGDQGHRYMQIPDTITLGGGASQSGGQGASDDPVNDNLGRVQGHVEEVPQDQPIIGSDSGEGFGAQANTGSADLEERLRTLETKVEQISEELQRQGRPVGPGISNFWYVMTFATWMLVPLISVIMYRYKK